MPKNINTIPKNKQGEKGINNINIPQNNNIPVETAISGEIVEQANKDLLKDKIRARGYFKNLVEQIIKEQGLGYNSAPKDPGKEYPKLDCFGWFIVLDYINIHLEQNEMLLESGVRPRYDNSIHGYNSDSYKYNYNNTLCMMDVYIYLCGIYGFIPSSISFLQMVGIDRDVFIKWASTGKPNICKMVDEIGKGNFAQTFINSKIPIERMYTANNLYGMDKTPAADNDIPQLEVLPDLLALPAGAKNNSDIEL